MSCFYIKQVRQRTKRFKQPSLWIGAFNHTHTHTNRVCVCVQEFLFVTSVQLKWDAVISNSRCICRTATTTNEAVCHLWPCRFFSDRSHIDSRFYLFVCSIKLSLCCTFMFSSYRVWGAVKICHSAESSRSVWVTAVFGYAKLLSDLFWELQLSLKRPDATSWSSDVFTCSVVNGLMAVHVLLHAGIREFYLWKWLEDKESSTKVVGDKVQLEILGCF